MGRIRIQDSRTLACAEQLSQEGVQRLFSLAADRFLLGETSDFLITEFDCLRTEIEGIQPPGHEFGLRWLLLQDVARFLPLRTEDSWAFEADAHKAKVALSEALYEPHWNQWFKEQSADQAHINGLTLIRALELGTSSNQAEVAPPAWAALATQLVQFNTGESTASDFSGTFIKNCNRLFDQVREDIDCGAFFVSCPIEWINLKSDTLIFDTDAELAEKAQRLHEKYFNVPFESSLAKSEDIRDFESLLLEKAPDAFPGAWRPSLISLYVRYEHKIRFGSFGPDEIIAAVRAIDAPGDKRPAELLAFLFGVVLGSNKAHGLERLLHPKRFEAVSVVVPDIEQSVAEVDNFSPTHNPPAVLAPELKTPQITDIDIRDEIVGEYHVLTYAENGFSPLDNHASRFGLDLEKVRAFAEAVNAHSDVRSLHPYAPITAVPQGLVRDSQDVDALTACIRSFFHINRETLHAQRLVFDFRTPFVPEFAVEALTQAIKDEGDCGLDEILILHMKKY
jgi:hypothetical protein